MWLEAAPSCLFLVIQGLTCLDEGEERNFRNFRKEQKLFSWIGQLPAREGYPYMEALWAVFIPCQVLVKQIVVRHLSQQVPLERGVASICVCLGPQGVHFLDRTGSWSLSPCALTHAASKCFTASSMRGQEGVHCWWMASMQRSRFSGKHLISLSC